MCPGSLRLRSRHPLRSGRNIKCLSSSYPALRHLLELYSGSNTPMIRISLLPLNRLCPDARVNRCPGMWLKRSSFPPVEGRSTFQRPGAMAIYPASASQGFLRYGNYTPPAGRFCPCTRAAPDFWVNPDKVSALKIRTHHCS